MWITWTFSTSFLHGLRGFFNRIWFPLYFLIYRMIFSRQWIILFWWYLTPTSLIFAGQRIKTDWGKTWGWTLFRWVSFVLCPAFLMIGNNKEATLRKKKIFFRSSGTASNLRDGTHKIPGLGVLARASGAAGCDFWLERTDHFLRWYRSMVIYQPSLLPGRP